MMLLPCGKESCHGFVEFGANKYRIFLQWVPNREFKCHRELQLLLGQAKDVVTQRLHSADTPQSFLHELQHICEKLSRECTFSSHLERQKLNRVKRMYEEIEMIGWDKVVDLNDELTQICFEVVDEALRRHQITFIHAADGHLAIVYDLPVKMHALRQIMKELSMYAIFRNFERFLKQYQCFWTIMEDFDNNCWIVEPENPSKSCTTRRIVLQKSCSVEIEVNPEEPRDICKCRFYGSSIQTDPLREKFESSISKAHVWDASSLPRINLEHILNVRFPEKQKHSNEEFGLECGICYTFSLAEIIPDQSCENPHCARSFHRQCLYEWLKALPSTRSSFDTAFGNCPYCSHPITSRIS